jgi:hypothetical protein
MTELSHIIELERSHNQDYFDKVRIVKECRFLDEFIDAVKDEEYGLQRIIEAYDKRMILQRIIEAYDKRMMNQSSP